MKKELKKDKYNAIWVSHSSLGDFLKCPRCYYLHNVYKDPKTSRKINIVNPTLSLGSAIHETIESLIFIKAEDRFKDSLIPKFEKSWNKVSGKKGGFISLEEEKEAKNRAISMIKRVEENPGPLLEKAVKIKNGKNEMPPNYFLSEEENIILCGKIDWLVYRPNDDSLHILDFKTGRNEEKEESLQLPIYLLLLKNLQKRKISGASYWYIDRDLLPKEITLPNEEETYKNVLRIAKEVKIARNRLLNEDPKRVFICPKGNDGCYACRPFEKIIRGEAECVGVGDMRQNLFIV